MFRKLCLFVLMVVVLIGGCTGQKGSATAMLPDVPNTSIVEGQKITDFLAKLADGAALLAGNPELIPAIERVEASLSCYQGMGAVALRAYTDKAFPLSAGMVAIVDGKALTDPGNFLNCVVTRAQARLPGAPPAIDPCAKTYTLKKEDNDFYIAYIATTQEMCDAFCSRLESCTTQ
jgi:hypothetical protein